MIVLDTHVLIWWTEDRGRLSARAAAGIAAQSPPLVSPISMWELAMLVERGRVTIDRDVARWCRDLLATGRVRMATLTASMAIAAARLPEFHGDPADRFIYATARELGATLASKDERMREYGRRRGDVEVIW